MSIDKMGSRFYMQQGIASTKNTATKKPVRLKADIIKDVQDALG